MKLKPIIAAAAILLSCVSCSSTSGRRERSSVQPTQAPTEPATEKRFSKPSEDAETDDMPRIRNYMNPDEKRSVKVHGLTLLNTEELKEHTLSIEVTETDEEPTQKSDADPGMTDEDTVPGEESSTADSRSRLKALSAAIDGCRYKGVIPPLDYNGGEFTASFENGDGETAEMTFSGLESYLSYEKERSEKRGDPPVKTDSLMKQIRFVFEGISSGEYDTVRKGRAHWSDKDPFTDYRSSWSFDAGSMGKIQNSTEEIELYDEKLDRNFLAEVTLPPGYDRNSSYPVLLLTDAAFFFGCVPELYGQMERGETEDVIIVSLGYDYGTDSASDEVRVRDYITKREDMHSFIVNNLMPLLGEMYIVDYDRSSLFGYSCAAVMVQYAMLNEDKFENQVFGRYAIASPVFSAFGDDVPEGWTESLKAGRIPAELADKPDRKFFIHTGNDEYPAFENSYAAIAAADGSAGMKYDLSPKDHSAGMTTVLSDMMKEFYPPAEHSD